MFALGLMGMNERMTPEAAMGVKILDNELVKKYFKCDHDAHFLRSEETKCMALRVLAAMEEPLKHGDRIILLSNDCGYEPKEVRYIQDLAALGPIHPLFLRLPDAFQPKREDKFDPELDVQNLRLWGYNLQELRSMRDFAFSLGWKPKLFLNPVEAKMKDILDNWQSDATPPGLVIELEKLVELVRQEKA